MSLMNNNDRQVAPLAGSVDRNFAIDPDLSEPSWVAPLAGSVDRNIERLRRQAGKKWSLPSRGAWIEIRRYSA